MERTQTKGRAYNTKRPVHPETPHTPWVGSNATEVGARLNGVPPIRAGVRRSSISQTTAWLAIPKGCLAPGPKRLPLNGFSSQESSRQNR